jgi:hypothetical protein
MVVVRTLLLSLEKEGYIERPITSWDGDLV